MYMLVKELLFIIAFCRAAVCSALLASAPVAWPAGVLKDVLGPSDHVWFQERFQEAAIKRYGRLQSACNEAVGAGAPLTCPAHVSCAGDGNMQASLPTWHKHYLIDNWWADDSFVC